MLTNELIRTKGKKELMFFKDCIIKVQINYSTGIRKRLSKTSIYLRVTTNLNRSDVETTNVTIPPYTISPNLSDKDGVLITVEAREFGNVLLSNVVTPMLNIQSSEVVYKSVDIQVYQGVNWDPLGHTTNGSNLIPFELHRYKCGSNLAGQLDVGSNISDKSLVFSLYGVGMPPTYSKPSRFLVQGTVFSSDTEARGSAAVGSLESFLNSVIIEKDNKSQSVAFIPLSDTYGALRSIDIAQLEGLRKLARSAD